MHKTLLVTLTALALSTEAVGSAPVVRREPLDAATLSDKIKVRQADEIGQRSRFQGSPRDVLAIAIGSIGRQERDPV